MPSPRSTRAVLLLVVGLFASLLALGAGSTAVAAVDKGLVNGSITCPKLAKCPGIKLLWFDKNWKYLGSKGANGGGYSLTLPPGTYHLQFVDKRPAYDVKKFAPTDVKVTVRANDLTKRNVTMQKGAAVTGTAKGGGKALGGATIVAANQAQQSFTTTANDRGQFAIGGLPEGKYSLFTFDKRKAWVGKSTWAGAVKPGRIKNVNIKLTKKAGNLTLYLFTPDGLLNSKTTLTVTSKQTGQWWNATSGNGTFVFKGLYPGRYKVEFKGAGVWFAKTGPVEQAEVKSGRMDFGSFHLTKRGGWVTGTVVDKYDPTRVMPNVTVQLFTPDGALLAQTTSGDSGNFKLTGPLRTQSDLTIVVQANADSGYIGQEPNRCQYTRSEVSGASVTTGIGTEFGEVGLERAPGQQRPECVIPADEGRAAKR